MFEAKFSTRYEAIKSRMKRLPNILVETVDTMSKKDAVELIETYKEGLVKNNFRLEPLKLKTVAQKSAKGYTYPTSPLVGAGDDAKNSYMNLWRIRKIKNGYRLFASWAKHHDSTLALRDLFQIHEYGAIIKQKRGNNIVLIRIPPRPAWDLAKKRWAKNRAKMEPTVELQAAIKQYLLTGKKTLFNKLSRKVKGWKDSDET